MALKASSIKLLMHVDYFPYTWLEFVDVVNDIVHLSFFLIGYP